MLKHETKHSGPKVGKQEQLRRVRLGQVRKVLRNRYGYHPPDDDAGREELMELVLICSLHPTHPVERMRQEIEVWAPWMSQEEAQRMISNVVRLPLRSRMAGKVALGKRLNLTDVERGEARAFSIMQVDVSDAELKERARERERLRKTLKRRNERMKPRRIYENEAASRAKPWEAMGISRATYYRRKEAGLLRETSLSATILRLLAPDTLVSRGGDSASPSQEDANERADTTTLLADSPTTVRPANNNRGCFAATRPVSGGEDRWSRVSKRQF